MAAFDLVVRGGEVVTATDRTVCDVGVRDGKIAALGQGLDAGAREIDAAGKLVMPGGIDSHCHIEQVSGMGVMCADDIHSGTVAAAFGGTTTIIPFAAQHRGQSAAAVVKDYRERGDAKAVIDYAVHLIITDPTEQVLGQELPALIRDGYTSFKVYMTYDGTKLDDYQMLEVLATARREGALTMIHAENWDMIRWLAQRLIDGGNRAPVYHGVSHAEVAEGEATHRAIALGRLLDTPLLIVHVSAEEAMEEIRMAQAKGLKVYGETCPQYLFLTLDDLDREGMEGAMFCCSPPPRDKAGQKAIWHGIQTGIFQVVSSDHAPYRFDETGKLKAGPNPSFKEIANGVPGIELRLPMLFSEGVGKGRIDIHRFVDITSTAHAKIYGLYPRKGTIAVGTDADMAIWDPERKVTVTADMLHDNTGYTPYEGMELTGWPVQVVSRGRVVVEDGELHAEQGSGIFQPCDKPESAKPLGRVQRELDPKRNFGANLLF